MESISISRLDLILKQFIRIDQYKWYCRLLKEYAMEAFTVNGIPAPIYVAKRMAYSQENDNFGMVEMTDFLVPLCNTAFLLHCQTPEIAAMKEKTPNFDVTFDNSICQDIIKMEKELSRKIRSHIVCLEGLRALQKKVAAIREKLSSVMKESLTHAYSDMIQAVYMVKEQDGFNLVDQQLTAVNIDGIVEKLYDITSATYNTPVPEDFIQARGFDEQLAEIYYKECDYKVLGMKNRNYSRKLKTEKTSLFGKTESRKGYQVKLKLSLMDGHVGFGWCRQNALFRQKKWGFYFMTPEYSTTSSTIGVSSESSLKAIEVTDCSDDFREQGDNPCVVPPQETDKHENLEKKEQEDVVVVPMIEKLIAECIHEIELVEKILVV
ncbi:unnamed protein product [Mytilus edulis]|uniref:Uncharacterized protein n=1 Tax=Mytilus edulis TaxID=6550 RepID=A0A8S3T2X8_MYTED|nr:unnamed protein product [Mytilus edulis]